MHFFSVNGNILPIDNATISLRNIAYAYGFGVYENIRVRRAVAFFAHEHITRLLQSAIIIELAHPWTLQQIEEAISALAEKIPDQAYNLKILLVGAAKPEETLLYLLPLAPRFPNRKWKREGVATMTVPFERPYPQAKTLSMLQSYRAYTSAQSAGCYDALATDRNGSIIEGTRTNFFVMRGTTIISPPHNKILPGVTKMILEKIAEKNNFPVEHREIFPNELPSLDAAFLTNTSAGILPIARIDDFMFPPLPDAFRHLMKIFEKFIDTSHGKINA